MAEFTPNYNLEKPAGAEKYYISKFNANADKIDEALKGHDDTIAANKTQEEQDIADTKEYADNAVSAHNNAEGDNVHPYLQREITEAANKALADAKKYAYSKTETDERISVHNSDESAHQDIRNIISGMGTDVQTNIENAIAVHNASPESHPDIRTDYANYTNNVVSTHNNDPEAHGGSFEINAISNDDYESGTIDKTWDELNNAYDSIRNVVLKLGDLDVKITSYNNVDVEYYGNYFDGFDEHRVIIFKDENNIPTFINKSIWAVSPYVDYGKTNYMYLRT